MIYETSAFSCFVTVSGVYFCKKKNFKTHEKINTRTQIANAVGISFGG
jgi:hypothetical protein